MGLDSHIEGCGTIAKEHWLICIPALLWYEIKENDTIILKLFITATYFSQQNEQCERWWLWGFAFHCYQ